MNMKLSLDKSGLLNYIWRQLNSFFPDGKKVEAAGIKKGFEVALSRAENCFSHIHAKYYVSNNQLLFNHLNSDQYCTFLYFLANTLFSQGGDLACCTKIYLLNKSLHGIDIYYEVGMPDIFLLSHPLGTVLGRAQYSNYLIVYQQCNVGSNKGIYPKLGKYVTLHPRSSVLGACNIGNYCSLAAGSLIVDSDLKNNCVYFGYPQNCHIKENNKKNSIWR